MAPTRPISLRNPFSFSSSKRAMSPGPPSPTFTEATNVSVMNMGANGPSKIITRAHLKSSIQAYEDLVNSCSAYRAALVAMSGATATFADAMERCSALKGPTYEAGTRLQAASGVHHLMSNLWKVLSDTLDNKVEKPLRQHLETYRTVVQERSQDYEHSLKEKSRIIHDTELRSMNRKQRNLQSFREALSILQRQVDELDELKVSHYQEILDHEEEIWNGVQSKVCVAVRSTMDVFDRVTSKASDPIIEPMLQTVPDPFDSYGPPQSENQIFSILAPLSIMSPSPSPSPVVGTPEGADQLGSDLSDSHTHPPHPKITSWLPSASNGVYPIETTDWASGSSSPTSPLASLPLLNSAISPLNTSRRHSVLPSRNVKAESKSRSVLPMPAIEESNTPSSRSDPENPSANRRALASSEKPLFITTTKTSAPPQLVNATGIWDYEHGQSSHEPESNENNGQLTPRNSTLFSPLSPAETVSTQDLDQHEKESDVYTPICPTFPTT